MLALSWPAESVLLLLLGLLVLFVCSHEKEGGNNLGTIKFIGGRSGRIAAVSLGAILTAVGFLQTLGAPIDFSFDEDQQVGIIAAWPGPLARDGQSILPDGWAHCDGRSFSDASLDGFLPQERSPSWNALVSAVSPYSSPGEPPRLPDLRGYFLRGAGEASEDHKAGPVGEVQDDAIGPFNIYHAFRNVGGGQENLRASLILEQGGSDPNATNTQQGGRLETRPINVAVHWIIRVK